MPSKILIATTCRWFSAARLAMAFAKAGCSVEMASPSGHPVLLTHAIQNSYAFNGLTPLRSLRAAILASEPDFIVPCDELTMKYLHQLYAIAAQSGDGDSKTLCELIEFSFGDPAGYPITGSRDLFMTMVRQENIRTPENSLVNSAEEVEQWLAQHGLPAVLKIDGTSGGEGVKIAHTLEEAIRAYRTLRAPLSTMVVAKRTCLDRDWNCLMPWLWQHQRGVSIQSFVTGPDANIAVASWRGEILSSISVEVLQTWRPKGPATLVRLIQNKEILHTAEIILRKLKFSGLCGFDFIIDKATGYASLIEMNARATQTAPLPLGPGRDLIASLCSMIMGQSLHDDSIDLGSDTIALFPLAWQGDTSSEIFQSSYHDIPLEEPELVRLGMKQARDLPHKKWLQLLAKMGQQ